MRGNCGKNNVFRQLVIKRQHYFYTILNYVHGDQMPGHWYFAMYFGLDAMELDIEKKLQFSIDC